MKRFFVLFIAGTMLFSLFGCGRQSPQVAESNIKAEAEIVQSNVDRFNFVKEFKAKISEYGGYRILDTDVVECDDGTHIQPIPLYNDNGNVNMHASVSYDKYDKVTDVSITTDAENRIEFAVFSYYIYTCMGFCDFDADTFYSTFAMLSDENSSKMIKSEGWTLYCFTTDKYITFFVSLSESLKTTPVA